MGYAVSNIHYFYYSWEYFLESMNVSGIRKIDLYGSMPHVWIDHHGYYDSKKIVHSANAQGCEIVVFTPKAYNYCIFSPKREHAELSRAYYRNCIDFAKASGITKMALSLPEGYLDFSAQDLYKHAIERVRALMDHAAKRGIQLLLEPVPGRLLCTINDMKRFLNDLDRGKVGISLCMCHLQKQGENLPQWLDRFGEQIRYVRIANLQEKRLLERSEYDGLKGVFIHDDVLWDVPRDAEQGLL